MTELDLAVPFSGIDPRGRVKFSVLLEMFQEMADVDASKYGLSVRQTLEHNITWVLRKYRIELEKYPTKESGDIHIKTYAEPCRNLFSLRSFKLWDSRGEFLGEEVGLGRKRGGGVDGAPLGEGVRWGGGERRLLRARNDTYVASGLGHQRQAGQPEADEHEEHEFSHHRFIQTLFRGVKLRKTI